VEGQKIAGDKGGITTKRNQRAPGGRTKRFYREAIDEILEGIEHQLSQGKKVSFLGLLTVACLDRLCYTIPIFLRKKKSAYDDIC
jgi:hypothetical protein